MNVLIEYDTKRTEVWVFEEGYDPYPAQVMTLLATLPGCRPIAWGPFLKGRPFTTRARERFGIYILTTISEEAFVGLGEAFSRFLYNNPGEAGDFEVRRTIGPRFKERFEQAWGPL